MISYQKISNLLNSYFSDSVEIKENSSPTENLFGQIELDLKKERTSIKRRIIFWIFSVQGLFFMSHKSKKIPHVFAIGAAGIGLCHTLYSIHRIGKQILGKSKQKCISLNDSSKAFQPAKKKTPPILDFPLPAHIENMLAADLEGFNRDQPIQYFTVGGGRVGISIDGGRVRIAIDAGTISPEVLSARLKIIEDRYPHLSQIKIIHFRGSVRQLVQDLLQFRCLSYLSFESCLDLYDEDLRRIDALAPKLKRLDLIGCNALSSDVCAFISGKYAVTFPDGTSNLDDLFEKFYTDLKRIFNGVLLKIVKFKIDNIEKKLNSEKGMDKNKTPLVNLIALREHLAAAAPKDGPHLDKHKKIRADLMAQLDKDLDPTHLDPSIKNTIMWELSEEIQKMLREPYIAVLGSKFTFQLNDMILCDEWFKPLLEAFHSIDAFLSSLNIANSYLTGHFLEAAKGLPIERLMGRNLRNLDNTALKHLEGFSELKHLDLSESPLTSEGLIQSLRALSRLKTLHLDRCILFSSAAFKASIIKLMFKGLELLTIIGATQIAEETIEELIDIKGIDLTTPFLIVSDRGGIRTVDISATHRIDSLTMQHLETIQKKGNILRIVFGKGTRLGFDDLQKLRQIPNIQFFEIKTNEIETDVLKSIPRIWPIQSILLGRCQIKISELKSEAGLEAEEISISTPEEIPSLIWPFLNSFKSIDSLCFKSPNSLKNKIDELAELCSNKKIKKLSLNNTNISDDDLEDLTGKPKNPVRKILSVCSSLHLEGTEVTENLFSNWQWDIDSEGMCSIYLGNGKKKVFN